MSYMDDVKTLRKDGFDKAVAKMGTKWKLGKALGMSKSAIYGWDRVPEERLLQVEQLTGIPREELRPDLARLFQR